MKKLKLITFVGVSFFEHYYYDKQNNVNKSEQSYYDRFAKQLYTFDDWNDRTVQKSLEKITKIVTRNGSVWKDNQGAAEIRSICKIDQEIKQPLEVYLIATDTVLSVKAALLVKEWFARKKSTYPDIQIHFELPKVDFDTQAQSLHIVKNLNFTKINDYRAGVQNLRQLLEMQLGIAGHPQGFVFNITAGYKAITPLLTMLAYRHKIPLYYMYHENNPLSAVSLIEYDLDDLGQFIK